MESLPPVKQPQTTDKQHVKNSEEELDLARRVMDISNPFSLVVKSKKERKSSSHILSSSKNLTNFIIPTDRTGRYVDISMDRSDYC